jgi:hypothetical protein
VSQGLLFGRKIGALIALGAFVFAASSRAAGAGALQYESLPLIRSSQNHLLVRAEVNR